MDSGPYVSTSTQQPAAICALKTPGDAIHILEAVRVGLVPRVTRRLTGHERSQIRPGTIWVWEEEETNMKRWTDGRRWGASRVGGGGFLVYSEASGNESSPQPLSRTHTPSSNGHSSGLYSSSSSSREPLIKQTFSTTMLNPSTGKLKKFHVVGYSSKHNPHGDAHSSLPSPAQLPLLSTLEVTPGIWREWEKQRDGASTKEGVKAAAIAASKTKVKTEVTTPTLASLPSPEMVMSYSDNPYSSRGPGSAPPTYTPETRTVSNPYEPAYYYPLPPSRSAPPYPVPYPLPNQDRYHPYRDRPGHYTPSQSVESLPSSNTSPYTFDDRRVSGSSSATHLVPPGSAPSDSNTYPYSAPPSTGHSPYLQPTYRDAPAARSPYPNQMPPPFSSPYIDQPNPYYHQMSHYPQHQHQSHQPRHPPARELSISPSGPDDNGSRSPQRSAAPTFSAEAVDSGRLTLPPLRVVVDRSSARHSPTNEIRSGPGLSPIVDGDRRGLGELGKKVSL